MGLFVKGVIVLECERSVMSKSFLLLYLNILMGPTIEFRPGRKTNCTHWRHSDKKALEMKNLWKIVFMCGHQQN